MLHRACRNNVCTGTIPKHIFRGVFWLLWIGVNFHYNIIIRGKFIKLFGLYKTCNSLRFDFWFLHSIKTMYFIIFTCDQQNKGFMAPKSENTKHLQCCRWKLMANLCRQRVDEWKKEDIRWFTTINIIILKYFNVFFVLLNKNKQIISLFLSLFICCRKRLKIIINFNQLYLIN